MSTFLLSKFFSIQKTKKLDKSDLVIPLKGDKKYPYVTRTVNNNGIESYTGYIDDFHLNPGNSFSLGLLQMNFQWHAEPWYCGQFVRRIVPKYDFSRNVMLYFLSVLQKNSFLFDPQAIKRVDGIFNSLRVDLPVTSDGQLDVQYMEQYIKRIEAQYIKRIEAYLSVIGYDSIDDCELSSQDLKVLSGPDDWGEFKIGDLFDEIQIGRKYVRNELSSHGQTPVYSSVEENGGVLGYINNQAEFELDVSHPYIVFGDHTRTMQIPDNDFSVADNVKVLRGKHAYSVKQLLYIMTCFKKVIPDLGYSRHWTTAKKLDFYLPVYDDGSIAYDYMSYYITAIEKKKVLKLKQAMDHKLDLYREMSHQD